MRDAINGVDAVVHLAALVSVEGSVNNPFETHDVNVSGTLIVLEEAAANAVRKFVYASSTAVYGDGKLTPLKEECSLKPMSPYAASKASAECYCIAFHRSHGLGTVILRYFNVYGPRQTNSYGSVMSSFLHRALSGKRLCTETEIRLEISYTPMMCVRQPCWP